MDRGLIVLLFSPWLALTGCGGNRGSGSPTAPPISVSLAVATVMVSQNGTPVIVPISIMSTSETATVAVSGLPGALEESYAASDTNPSGDLKFTAGTETQTGSYKPTITVNSADQTASTSFTLIVTAAAK